MDNQSKETDRLIDPNQNTTNDFSSEIKKVVLSWENLSYRVKNSNIDMQVLKEVSGFANPKEILAIMGASGSGKTSMLNILSNRIELKDDDEIAGSITANNQSLFEFDLNPYIKFIPQDCILNEYLTPFEYLLFTLKLKTPISDSDARKRVEEILSKLKLKDVRDTLVGGMIHRGISGGEKKRLCIASELMFYPSVLILDEPTSGLDSYMTKTLISILNEIKELDINIIMSIHQPGNDVFNMFDRLIIMQDGKNVFQGKASNSIEYFKEAGFDIPKLVNPPEVYMRILKLDNKSDATEEEKNVKEKFRIMYEKYDKENWKDMKSAHFDFNLEEEVPEKLGVFMRVRWLFWREALNYKRNYYLYVFKVLYILGMILVLNLLYYDTGYDEIGIMDRKGILIGFLITTAFATGITCTMTIVFERKLTIKEINDYLYSVMSYLLVKVVIELIFMVLISVTFTFCIYYTIGLNTESQEKVFILCLVGMISYLYGALSGMLAGTISDSFFVANAFGSALVISQMLFSGYYIDPDSSPEVFQWLKYSTPMYFFRNAVMINEFDDLDIDDDVTTKPKELFGYEGTLTENILLSVLHVISYFVFSYMFYSYTINKSKIKKAKSKPITK